MGGRLRCPSPRASASVIAASGSVTEAKLLAWNPADVVSDLLALFALRGRRRCDVLLGQLTGVDHHKPPWLPPTGSSPYSMATTRSTLWPATARSGTLGAHRLSTNTGKGLCCCPRPTTPAVSHTCAAPAALAQWTAPDTAQGLLTIGFAIRHDPHQPLEPQSQTLPKRHGRLRAVTRVAIAEAPPQRQAPIATHPQTAHHLLEIGTSGLCSAHKPGEAPQQR